MTSEEGNDMNGIDRRDNGTFIKMQRRGLVQTLFRITRRGDGDTHQGPRLNEAMGELGGGGRLWEGGLWSWDVSIDLDDEVCLHLYTQQTHTIPLFVR